MKFTTTSRAPSQEQTLCEVSVKFMIAFCLSSLEIHLPIKLCVSALSIEL